MTAAQTDRRADLIHVARTRYRIPLLRAGERLTFTTRTPEAIMDDELDTALNRVSLGIDALAAERDRLQAENAALRAALERAASTLVAVNEAGHSADARRVTSTIHQARAALAASTKPE